MFLFFYIKLGHGVGGGKNDNADHGVLVVDARDQRSRGSTLQENESIIDGSHRERSSRRLASCNCV